MILDKIYSKIQNEIKKEQPFNEELFNLRSEERVENDIVSIFDELKIFPNVLDVKVTFDKKEENNYNKSFRSIDETRTYKARWEIKFSINKIKPDDKDLIEFFISKKNLEASKLDGSKEVIKQIQKKIDKVELRTTYNPILNDEFENDLEIKNFNETDKNQQIVILKGEFQVPRLINNLFYIFKGNKYYVRNQVIDKLVYLVKNKKQTLKLYNTETGKPMTSGEGAKIRVVSNKNSIALRTATMQITANREKAYLMNDEHIVYATNLFSFNKNFDSLLLILSKYAFNSLTRIEATQDDFEKKHYEWRDNTLMDKINGFFGVNFSMVNENQIADFGDEYFIKFRLRTKDVFGPYLIVPKDEFEEKVFSKTIVGSFQKIFEQYCGGYNPKTETKIPCFIKETNANKENVVTVENFINRPCVFIELLYHQMMAITKGRTYHEKYNKINGLLLSIKRLIQPNTFKINHSEINEPIENFLELMRYVLVNYDSLLAIDQLDLGNKKIRTSESVVYHLRIKIASILFKLFTEENLTLRTLKLIFLSIGENKKMLIDDLIKNDLLVYNNNTNEINSFLSLKMTFGGRGGLSKNVPTEMRGIHPTYVGKISLVASSNRNPGITSTLVPFTTIDENGFFTKPDIIDKNKFLK